VISLADGQLFLGGRMIADRIVSRGEAIRTLRNKNLWKLSNEHIIGKKAGGTPLNLHRRLAPEVSRQLRFVSPDANPKGLFFKTSKHIDNQATRGVRELTSESAALLDRVIELTDRLSRSGKLITVTEALLESGNVEGIAEEVRLPEEVPLGFAFSEGSVQRILVNRYERDPRARAECIRHHGTTCSLCAFDFVAVYGKVMTGFVHVHHLNALSSIGAGYEVNPIQDLRPVCPNCHAVLHRRQPPYSLDEVRELIRKRESNAF
jgi:predicted HNH restriction endonuclease